MDVPSESLYTLGHVLDAVYANGQLRALSLGTLIAFVRLVAPLTRVLAHRQRKSSSAHIKHPLPPRRLPEAMCAFISCRLSLSDTHVVALWDMLRLYIWTSGDAILHTPQLGLGIEKPVELQPVEQEALLCMYHMNIYSCWPFIFWPIKQTACCFQRPVYARIQPAHRLASDFRCLRIPRRSLCSL